MATDSEGIAQAVLTLGTQSSANPGLVYRCPGDKFKTQVGLNVVSGHLPEPKKE